jgi:DNA-binding IclR family transcriptional regulator
VALRLPVKIAAYFILFGRRQVDTNEPKTVSMADSAGNVRVLARGLAILQAFEPDNSWLSNANLALLTGIPKPTVSRITANLTASGYLTYSAEKAQYKLGAPVLALGYLAVSTRDLKIVARPLMQKLADEHNASIVLASPDGLSMVCHEVCHSRNMLFTLRVRPGSRLKLSQSALGRAFISAMNESERSKFMAALAEAEPDHWSVLKQELEAAIRQMRDHQYCTASGTLENGTNGIAVVIDMPGQPHAYAIGCAVPEYLFPVERLEAEVAPQLLQLKHSLERDLNASAQAS